MAFNSFYLNDKQKIIHNGINFKFRFPHSNNTYSDIKGIITFMGSQGSGKTLTACKYGKNIFQDNPDCILVSNIQIDGLPIITYSDYLKDNPDSSYDEYLSNNRIFPFNNNDDFLIYKNQDKGVIFLIDEIQLYLNPFESKNTNLDLIIQLSKEREQDLHIISTLSLSDYFTDIVLCKGV